MTCDDPMKTMRVYLVQHGEAKPEEEDAGRHLTQRGIADVQKVADFLRPLKLSVLAIWHSGKPRAAQTAQILTTAVRASEGVVERGGLGPKRPVKPIRKAIEQAGGDLMVVGHLPFLAKLAGQLMVGKEEAEVIKFAYGGVVCLEREEQGSWRVAWMILPELLKG
jgi:phosphohistidine phosphatase